MNLNKLKKLKQLLGILTPIFIKPNRDSVTITISKRFFIFEIIKFLSKRLEADPYLNFISLLKHYKILEKFLYGNISEFYRDRNKSYFKKFFSNYALYEAVKNDIEWVYSKKKDLKLTITKKGIIIYDNYKKNSFNLLLLTIHSGDVVPDHIAKKQIISKQTRTKEEDINTDRIYGQLIFSKNGIWINTKLSRFACDYNRSIDKAIYSDNSEVWLGALWKEPLSDYQKKWLLESYREFYFSLARIIDSYRFNIIFDGHSMNDGANHSSISFGTKYIPQFYMPIVKSMQQQLIKLGYDDVVFDKPYSGGHILEWLRKQFPDIFIFSMEINKKLYLDNMGQSIQKQEDKLANDITKIVNIEEENND